MRILLTYGLVGRGGDAVQVLEIAEAFRRLQHEIELIGPTQLRPYDFTSSAARWRGILRRLPWWGKDSIELGMNLYLFAKIQQTLRDKRFDLVLHRAGIYDFVGARLADAVGCPVAVFLDAPFALERAFRNEKYFAKLHRRCMRKLGEKAALMVTVSRAARDYYVHMGLSPEKTIVLPNGISQDLLQKGAQLAQEHPPFAHEPPFVVGFVGSLSRWHRVDLLLEALRELEGWRVQIVGYGEEYANLRAYAQKLKLEQCIEWLGALPHERAFEQIVRFDIAVLPHTLPTGAPMKLFEYAALARPTIVPDLPNLRELFTDKEMCFVEPENPKALAEAMLWLAQHPQEAVQLGWRAQVRVQEYSWEGLMERLLGSLT